MAKKQFYAVLRGRKPGIYSQWSGTNGAEEQVKGYPGAVFKGFSNRGEAEHYLRNSGEQLRAAKQLTGAEQPIAAELSTREEISPPRGGEPRADVRSPQAPRRLKAKEAYKVDLASGKVVVFTDGASTGNPGPGGYGVVLLYGDARKELSAGFRCTTNNRMELLACIVALRELKRQASVVIYSDSRYVVYAVKKGWALRWRKNNWMRPPDEQGQVYPAENIDLWEQMLDLLDRYPVELRWVKGHASHPENERCDQLAVQAAHQPDLLQDPGYKNRC